MDTHLPIMKKTIILLSLLALSTASAVAQTEVLAGVMRGKDYGVTYRLPQTEIAIEVQTTLHTYTPGEFCKYADRYLRMDNISTEKQQYWTLDEVKTSVVGVPDPDKVYFVKLKDKSTAPLMELTEDGIVRTINVPFSGQKAATQAAVATTVADELPDPRTFLTEEILMANSTVKMAELVAKEIYTIRESKNDLLRGEADNMPTDGAQLKLMLDNLNLQEAALTAMFTGKTVQQTQTTTVRLTPREMTDEVALRFSSRLGVVGSDNLAGEPVYISVKDMHTLPALGEDEVAAEKKLEGVAYNVPGKARVSVTYRGQSLFQGEVPVTQFGTTEYLAAVLFNKNVTTKVYFDTVTGGLLKVDRSE